MPARYRIEWSVSQKEDLARSYRLLDQTKMPVDLTGASIAYKAKQGVNVIEASTASGSIVIDDAVNGEWSILIAKETLAPKPAGAYSHDLLITIGGVTEEFWVGTLELRPGV